jgi:DNA-binding NtrC family response regulator
VIGFNAPRECLDWLLANPVDLVILDVKMPEMDGVELYYKIQEARPGMRTIFITGSVVGRSLDTLRTQGRGLVRVVRKPFRIEHLYRTIGSILGATDESKHRVTPLPA